MCMPAQHVHRFSAIGIPTSVLVLFSLRFHLMHFDKRNCVLLPAWALAFSCLLKFSLHCSGLPPRPHKKFIEISTQQTCKKAPLSAQYTPHQLSLSRLRKIVPEEHHSCNALQLQTSPGMRTYRRSVSCETKNPVNTIIQCYTITA